MNSERSQKNITVIIFLVIIAIIIIIFSTRKCSDTERSVSSSVYSKIRPSNWINISYGDLIDKTTITHSGETVGEIIRTLSIYTDEQKGLVQEYLEPYSILCHSVLLTTLNPDTIPLINILSYYPVGSEQPAWVDLFREGHYQLYFNRDLIRVFCKGGNPDQSFQKHLSVIRHPILDIINSPNLSIDNLEVYVFKNDYASTQISLNTIPAVYKISEIDLSPKQKPIDLVSLEEFFNQKVNPEAVEVDENNNLLFYGTKSIRKTLAGFPLSISDLAVVYRSIFHYGYNAPYISLDKNEDNRYAKVNFGGHLANTHAGDVVLEADKFFKTLSTGIDPNTHQLMKNRIKRKVPDFLTEDERNLMDNDYNEGQMQIRYWFYPDSIGTVTNGSIGAVLTNQFMADVERMDIKIKESAAVRSTIDHFNLNYKKFESVSVIFKELSTLGRLMALTTWLKRMNMGNRIDLDALLSVKIPAYKTPEKTKKMLALTTLTYPANKVRLNNRNIDNYTKVYYISHLLEHYNPATTDETFLEGANEYYDRLNFNELAPTEYNELESLIDYYNQLIKENETNINSLEKEIKKRETNLNSYSSSQINAFNALIDEYNALVKKQEIYISKYNSKIKELNVLGIQSNQVVSVGGGINLRPKEFKLIVRDNNSSKIREIIKVKDNIRKVGHIAQSGDWIISNPSRNYSPRINELPIRSLSLSKSVNGNIKYEYSNSGENISLTLNTKLQEWEMKASLNGYIENISYSKKSNHLLVRHSGVIENCSAILSTDGKEIVFSR